MFLDPLNIERTEWKTKDLNLLFKNLKPLFPQLFESDFEEIDEKLSDDNIEYLEIAHYEKSEEEQKDPSSILVFQNNRVFYDIVDLDRKSFLVEKFKELSADAAHFIKSRKITKNELKKRVEALMRRSSMDDIFGGFDENEEGDESFVDFIEKDDEGVLERSAFYLVSKEPVLKWLNESQKKEPRRLIPTGDITWTLEQINSEPTVFLMPSEMDLWPKKEQKIAWSQAKEGAFRRFLWGYYVDESYWPTDISERVFDQWFDIKPLGLVVDIAEDLDL